MTLRTRTQAFCEPLPGAKLSDPWGGGHDAWKVGGKLFACIGAVQPGVAVKCADVETAAMLIEAGIGTKAPYFHRSWILLAETVSDDDLRHRIRSSYTIIRAGLTAKVRNTLAPMEGD